MALGHRKDLLPQEIATGIYRIKHEVEEDGARKTIDLDEPVDMDAINDALELLSMRWKPGWIELNGDPPFGVEAKRMMLWVEVKNATAESKPTQQAFGTIGEELEEELEAG